MRLPDGLGRKGAALRAERFLPGGSRAPEQDALESFQQTVRVTQAGRDLRGRLAVVRSARLKDRQKAPQQGLVLWPDRCGRQVGERAVLVASKHRGEPRGIMGPRKALAVARDFLKQHVDVGTAEVAGKFGKARAGVFGEPVEQGLPQGARLPVVENRELRRDPSLQREAPQQAFAKGVNCLDAQAARGLQGAGKEGAGLIEAIGGDCLARLAEVAQGRAQIGVLQHRPAAERLEQPVLHLRSRGLGIGEAENALRLGSGEQQAGHAVREHACLAGAGIGGNPAGAVGRGCADLGEEGGRHAQGSVSDGSPSAHSAWRARWS